MAFEPEQPLSARPTRRFVGRRTELARLRRGVEDALGGRGLRLWLVGIPGIGKTRLLEEIAHYARLRGVGFRRAESFSLSWAADAPEVRSHELLLVDPVRPLALAKVEGHLQRFAATGGLALATLCGTPESIGVPREACLLLTPFGAEEVRGLLRAMVGRDLDAAMVATALRETAGNPAEVERWGEAFLKRGEPLPRRDTSSTVGS